jgi:hypothetical protein
MPQEGIFIKVLIGEKTTTGYKIIVMRLSRLVRARRGYVGIYG